jgi:hypothetical protein
MHRIGRRAFLGGACAALAGCLGRNAVPPPTPASALDTFSLRYKWPGERFYIIIFSSQSWPRIPRLSHTFATVIRTKDRPGREPEIDQHTISWLPATLNIRPQRFAVEPGVNLDMHTTIRWALDSGTRVSMWGPYETHSSTYRRFLVQKGFIDSGRVGYQCVDQVGESARAGDGCCCIHAITDMDPIYGRTNYPLIWFGDSASEHYANRLHQRTAIINPEADHSWLIPALGLNAYPIRRRYYQDRVLDFPRIQPGQRARQAPPVPEGLPPNAPPGSVPG